MRVLLSESPDAPRSTWVERYDGLATTLYAFVVIDSMPDGGYVSGFHGRLVVDNMDSNVRLIGHDLQAPWQQLDPQQPGFERPPSLPGAQTPAVVGRWTLSVDDPRHTLTLVGFGASPETGAPAPILLDGQGEPVSFVRTYPACIHIPAPLPWEYPSTRRAVPRRLDVHGLPVPDSPVDVDPIPGRVRVWLARDGLPEIDPPDRAIDLGEIDDALVRQVLESASPTSIRRTAPSFQRRDTLTANLYGKQVTLPDFSRLITVEYSADLRPDTLAQWLHLLPGVVSAEAMYPMYLASPPNDSLYADPPPGFSRWHPEKIRMSDVWDAVHHPTPAWRIGVLDTGVKWNHRDFGYEFGPGHKIFDGFDYYNNDHDPLDEDDDCIYVPGARYHGTKVTGLLGALTNNDSIGVASPAGGWHPETLGPEIIVSKIFGGEDCDWAGMIDALNASTDPRGWNCRIVNASFAGPTYSEQDRAACAAAYKRGSLLVCGSGNVGPSTDPLYPGSYDPHWIIRVGASDESDQRTTWSCYGEDLDLVAPGIHMTTTTWDRVHNPPRSGYEGTWEGTSASAPLVSGCAALLQDNTYRVLAQEDYEGLLRAGCVDVEWDPVGGYIPGPDEYTGEGRMDIANGISYFSGHYYFYQAQTDPAQNRVEDVGWDYKYLDGIPGLPADYYYCYVMRVYQEYESFVIEPPREGHMAWGVGSRTDGFALASPNYCEGWCDLVINQVPFTYSTTTYTYGVYDETMQHFYGTWPKPPSQVSMGYSVIGYVEDPTVGVQQGQKHPQSRLLAFGSPGRSPRLLLVGKVEGEPTLRIYDVSGRRVRTLDGHRDGSDVEFLWDGLDGVGRGVTPGTYFATCGSGTGTLRTRVVLTR